MKRQIPLFKVFMADEARTRVAEVLRSGYLGQGPMAEKFEAQLRGHFGKEWVNTVNSATSGLHLALHMLPRDGVRDEVITTPLTCTATNFAILAAGLKIHWCDVDPETGNLSVRHLRTCLSERTLAIMCVHWGGYPCDLAGLGTAQAVCYYKHGFNPPIIEDCAHAWGATYQGTPIGAHGNTCVFSFQAIKHLTTGDGGCLISPSEEHYRRAKLLRWYGLDRTFSTDFRCSQDIREWGFKYHMNDVAAAIGLANYPHMAQLVERHYYNGLYYNGHLNGVAGLMLMEDKPDRKSAFWVYTVRVERRDDFCRWMQECDIAVSRVHARNDTHSCLKEFRCPLPGMDALDQQIICLPCGWWVTNEDREYIVDCIKKGW